MRTCALAVIQIGDANYVTVGKSYIYQNLLEKVSTIKTTEYGFYTSWLTNKHHNISLTSISLVAAINIMNLGLLTEKQLHSHFLINMK